MKVAITAKRVVILMMTMALAVAIVACSSGPGAAGPAGPKGDKGDPGETPTTPPPGEETPPPTVDNNPPVAKMIPNVYLALAGTGKMDSSSVDLNKYITDSDSVLRFGATSSDKMVATVKEKDGVLTIMAKKAGPATIAVMAHDGSNDPVPAEIMVTVVKDNARPTTNGLSGSDMKKLGDKLYVADGKKSFTVTIVSNAGAADPVDDDIVDYKVMIGDKADDSDDKVDVMVEKDTGNKYVIDVTPKKGKAMGTQMVKIYPKDMFGAMVSKPWMFTAMFNAPPSVLSESFDTIYLDRDESVTGSEDTAIINITEYFHAENLDRTDPVAPATEATVGDTVCDVSHSLASRAVVQKLNTTGVVKDVNTAVLDTDLVKDGQALIAIRIDSRFSALGDDMIVTADDPDDDTATTATGTVSITISCTDKDASVSVTGKVVIRA